jgi:hypothetical protein
MRQKYLVSGGTKKLGSPSETNKEVFRSSITDGKVLEECKQYFQSNNKLEENEEDDYNANNPD